MEAQLSEQQRAADFGNHIDARLETQELARQQQSTRDQVTAIQQTAPSVAPVVAPGPPSPQQQAKKKHGQH